MCNFLPFINRKKRGNGMSQAKSNFTRRAVLAVIGAVLIALTIVTPLLAADLPGAAARSPRTSKPSGRHGCGRREGAECSDGRSPDLWAFPRDDPKQGRIRQVPGWPQGARQIQVDQDLRSDDRHRRQKRARPSNFDAQNEEPSGKITKAHIVVLQVWTKEKGGWKLLARQPCPGTNASISVWHAGPVA